MTDITKEQAVQLAREEFERDFIGNGPSATHTLERSGDFYKFMTANVAWTTWQRAWKVAYKLGRNAGLEEAKQICETPHRYFKDARTNIECALAIESMKDNK